MILYLFGGGGPNNSQEQWEHIFNVIDRIKPSQLLFIPFASRTDKHAATSYKLLTTSLKSVDVLNAMEKTGLLKANNPLIFVLGGRDHVGLIRKIKSNKILEHLIRNCKYYIGESAGSMVVGSFQRMGQPPNSPLIKGLGLLPDTIIEPHYTERNRHVLLPEEMKRGNIKYGIGLDEATAICINIKEYPRKWERIGEGTVKCICRTT
ncbi:hypothetical protein A2334_00500 [Candidatus Roizmanbacteria bacterium RIFOXYB2_FULL_38_10]|uniref:Peptidase E n=1 Tax=Candidatus Roizmanbacteria bacterium RIFOXYD1_FULL_38_12 TaxID=1802093 RepID=A0A1F7L180_9BACT|nr:MAG: hypothetical protein A3K47_03770 [Candidatus Roizmanbacteria bacterium RIFOXYA2_FULL_38_14]OGK63875.1 MAG: hypothetical protein A3K27_03770 [Candidatus Roizmanbacteria bacterium RIFOXYA1_FULL_37_12]OGK65721.1 MAG: hypothetical protein A3K38_03770 [Candidatus Roizmanbacteria bacterium RIFOXYB1_FULL_40_23]OGK68166.1 MAG: hypothetical protein A2334_00500 [Candidatus Roizmanbacteria bacterium RIFOXYB2_FULL_38_10]OGK70126.1 MAG: hypothetical protein A3K21_03775 [Candidatus Roizmanbacteria ba